MTVQRWEVASGTNVSLAGHSSWVRALGFSPTDKRLYSGGYEGCLAWWPATVDKPEPTRAIEAHTGWLRCLAVSPDGQLIATGGNDNLVKLWNAADGTLTNTLSGHAANVFSVQFHPAGQWLLSGDLLGQVHQWELSTAKLLRTFDAKELHTYEKGQAVNYGGVRSMAISPDGKSLACSGLHKATNPLGAVQDPLIMEFDWDSAKPRISHAARCQDHRLAHRLSSRGILIGRLRRNRSVAIVLQVGSGQGVFPLQASQHGPRYGSAPRWRASGNGALRQSRAHQPHGAEARLSVRHDKWYALRTWQVLHGARLAGFVASVPSGEAFRFQSW